MTAQNYRYTIRIPFGGREFDESFTYQGEMQPFDVSFEEIVEEHTALCISEKALRRSEYAPLSVFAHFEFWFVSVDDSFYDVYTDEEIEGYSDFD